jgi:hypothetical protein
MPRKHTWPPPLLWEIVRVSPKIEVLGTVEASDADAAIAKAAEQFNVPSAKIIAVRPG